ncbi:MAG TPA: CAP domain-containing protein [Terriglobales bacterium]|nr:CAP domain-containing protein [Terriglobales bacterium]
MLLAFLASMALLLPTGAQPAESANTAAVSATASADVPPQRFKPSPPFDFQGEEQLLTLTNQERQLVGAAPLRIDPNLTAAARAHALAMAQRRELSHQLKGEPGLDQRVASNSLHLIRAGENVALDVDVEQAHDGLMHSPHHRDNLLRKDYNIVGFGIARVGEQIYVVEDFGENVPAVSPAQAEDAVASAIARQRQLKRLQLQTLRRAACAMASTDHINPKQVSGLGAMRYVLSYTNLQPELLPDDAGRALADGKLRSFAVGSCYAHTATYPNGAYFVTVAFY